MINKSNTIVINLSRIICLVIALIAVVGCSALDVIGQTNESSDRDRPVRITSGEISVRATSRRTVYYSFTAGPGEVTFTVDGTKQKRSGFVNANITLFDGAAKIFRFKNGGEELQLRSFTVDERVIDTVRFDRQQTVVMRLEILGDDPADPGRIRVRLSGAVAGDQTSTPASYPVSNPPNFNMVMPARGILRIDMADGTTQDIDLSLVRQISIRP